MKKLTLVVAAALAFLSASAQDLTILHLNDTHSHNDPERATSIYGRGGVIEQAAYIDSVRTADGCRNVLLLHAGDFGQGTSYFLRCCEWMGEEERLFHVAVLPYAGRWRKQVV